MNEIEIAAIIKDTCAKNGVMISEMIFFGSRRRGDNRINSDYDFIAVCPNDITHEKKMTLWLATGRALAVHRISADILFKSEKEYKSDKTNKGKVTYYAAKEGVTV